ncbi:Disease resistance protein [Caenorhabditis elegans]|uniref:Disease resistance protein n=1 Tax=Caenorhabditis elegans TaxID=6239 RepID=H1ZUV3_CAEEL|nr:Disease resistance protein [Caenorhabditis elegans]CCF23397.1 Disease resistance protein [Caenorhabditis elegans]|eukprot:NP_001254048.1 Uncharacterized protein CELE_F07E5.12 [Caenorhabditis elegans]
MTIQLDEKLIDTILNDDFNYPFPVDTVNSQLIFQHLHPLPEDLDDSSVQHLINRLRLESIDLKEFNMTEWMAALVRGQELHEITLGKFEKLTNFAKKINASAWNVKIVSLLEHMIQLDKRSKLTYLNLSPSWLPRTEGLLEEHFGIGWAKKVSSRVWRKEAAEWKVHD